MIGVMLLSFAHTDDVQELPDEEVLVMAQSQPWIFTVLVDRYEAAFMRKAMSILHRPLDAEEVVQDAFTKIYINAAKFSPQDGAKFSSWGYRILMNTAFTRYQKLMKEGKRFTNIDPEFEQLFGERAEHSGFEGRKDAVERVLERLPGHFVAVLRLHYLERWSHKDIAAENGETVGTIKARIHRAKAAFRKEAGDEEIVSLLKD